MDEFSEIIVFNKDGTLSIYDTETGQLRFERMLDIASRVVAISNLAISLSPTDFHGDGWWVPQHGYHPNV